MIRVLGLGNVLMSDDGFGPYVARVLDALYEFPDGVEAIDIGTPGLDLTPYLLNTDAVIFLDTVASSGAPGETRVYNRADILRYAPETRTGGHDPALKEALLTVDAAGAGPKTVTLIGVLPASVAPGVTLSRPVSEAVGLVVQLVIRELARAGAVALLRSVPRDPQIWWAANPSQVLAD